MHRHNSGFSLIELLIVITITIMMFAVVTPRMNSFLKRVELKQLANKMASSLQLSHYQAISSGHYVLWTLDLQQHQFVYGKEDKVVSYSDDIEVIYTTASKEKISENKANIRFFPDGSATGGEVLLKGKALYRIQIDWLSGKVDIYEQ